MKTKLIIGFVVVAALALATVGLAAAQLSQNQTVPGAEPNTAIPAEGFWGWIGNCFRYGSTPHYRGEYVAPPAGVNTTAPYQGGYGYGYGPCWAQ